MNFVGITFWNEPRITACESDVTPNYKNENQLVEANVGVGIPAQEVKSMLFDHFYQDEAVVCECKTCQDEEWS